MPVGGFTTGKSPFQILPAQSLLDMGISGDIQRVIVTHKLILNGGEEGPNDRSKQQNPQPRTLISQPRPRFLGFGGRQHAFARRDRFPESGHGDNDAAVENSRRDFSPHFSFGILRRASLQAATIFSTGSGPGGGASFIASARNLTSAFCRVLDSPARFISSDSQRRSAAASCYIEFHELVPGPHLY